MTSHNTARGGRPVDWAAAGVVVSIYLTFMLLVAFAPAVLTKPLVPGGNISIGLASGVVIAVITIAIAGSYTRYRNRTEMEARVDPDPGGSR